MQKKLFDFDKVNKEEIKEIEEKNQERKNQEAKQSKNQGHIASENNFTENEAYIMHPYIKENTIIAKKYQIEIAKNCLNENTAVILPTGLGKTIIAILVIAHVLPKKILFLAPTKPLAMQHYESCKKFLKINEIGLLLGNVSKKKREELIENTIIVATPQTIENDLKKGLYNLSDFGLIIFDEMHKAVENYAYVHIANSYNNPDGLILGLTASPGSKKAKMNRILSNLKITHIESRTRADIDVSPDIKPIKVQWVKVKLDEIFRRVQKPLNEFFVEKAKKLNKVGILTYKRVFYLSKKDILGARALIQKRFGRRPYAFQLYITQSLLLQAYHCLELIETQGIDAFLQYVSKLGEKKTERLFLNDNRIKEAIKLAEQIKVPHPKINALKKILIEQFSEEKDSLILIFTQYRSTIDSIENMLNEIPNVRYSRFIGQSSESGKGMKQREQKEVIDKFRNREINVLIATQVAEEGIDVPNVNLVVFYEPIPSEIRAIQRKGRTGRSNIGKVKILITEDTRDEAYLFASLKKEKKMQFLIEGMR